VRVILQSVSADQVRHFNAMLTGFHKQSIIEEQKIVHKNLDTFILIIKEIGRLEGDLVTERALFNEVEVMHQKEVNFRFHHPQVYASY
jgi:hypothetical protein